MEDFYNYFNKITLLEKSSKKYKIFEVGDIIEFLFVYKSVPLLYSGICIAIRRKSFLVPDVILILRNIIMRVAVEVIVFFFYNRIYKLKFLDYKRKFYFFNKNKIFFLRKRLN